jgi:hypothetical protein
MLRGFHASSRRAATILRCASQWAKNCRHGQGVCVYRNGLVYEGEWHIDMMHGHGVLKDSKGVCACVCVCVVVACV